MNTKQQHDTIYTPYCYLIGWTKHNKFYYGVRYAKKYKCIYEFGCHPDDFWVTYTTSSEYVDTFKEKHGEPDVIQIRRTFNNAESAIEWEKKVLTRINAIKSEAFINKGCGTTFVQDAEVRKKIGDAVRGRKHTKEAKRKMSEWRIGKRLSEDHKRNISKAHKGKKRPPRSEEHTKKLVKSRNLSFKLYDTCNKCIVYFESRAAAAEKLNCSIQTVCNVLTGKQKTLLKRYTLS